MFTNNPALKVGQTVIVSDPFVGKYEATVARIAPRVRADGVEYAMWEYGVTVRPTEPIASGEMWAFQEDVVIIKEAK